MRQKATAEIGGLKPKPLISLRLLENSAIGSDGFQTRPYMTTRFLFRALWPKCNKSIANVMKRLVLATASVLAFVSLRPALSADLGPIAPIYKTAPVVPQTPFFTWTGCYVGAHVGGGLARKTFSDTASGHLVANPFSLGDNNPATLSFDPSGFIGGGQFGCNYQFAQEWVAGIDVDIDAADVQRSPGSQIPRLVPLSRRLTT
jgi:hypothetical protein